MCGLPPFFCAVVEFDTLDVFFGEVFANHQRLRVTVTFGTTAGNDIFVHNGKVAYPIILL